MRAIEFSGTTLFGKSPFSNWPRSVKFWQQFEAHHELVWVHSSVVDRLRISLCHQTRRLRKLRLFLFITEAFIDLGESTSEIILILSDREQVVIRLHDDAGF